MTPNDVVPLRSKGTMLWWETNGHNHMLHILRTPIQQQQLQHFNLLFGGGGGGGGGGWEKGVLNIFYLILYKCFSEL